MKSKLTPQSESQDFENEPSETKPLLSTKEKEIPYPKYVYFMLCAEMAERYSYYGLLTILALFLRNVQLYSESSSTIIYHAFAMLAYTTPIIGSVYADSILGKYKTVVYFSIIHTIGSALIGISAIPYIPVYLSNILTLVSLLIVAIGIGGIKPTIASFGGDQFKLPNQLIQLTKFFTIYYFMINCGAVLAVIFSPMLRKDVHCFGEDTCYSLAFGVSAVVIFAGLLLFLIGAKSYIVKPTTDSVLLNTVKCIMYSVGNRKSFETSKSHFLDSASDRFDTEFINDIKTLLQKGKIFSPLIIYWALWAQIGSSWVFQASRMDGVIFNGFTTIKPDQIAVGNPAMILISIPIFTRVIYPIMSKFHVLETHFQRIRFGCFLMSMAFILAGFLELELQNGYPAIPNSDETSISVVNTLPCNVTVEISPMYKYVSDFEFKTEIAKYDNFLLSKIPSVDYEMLVNTEPCLVQLQNTMEIAIFSHPGETESIIIYGNNESNLEVIPSKTREDLTKSLEGNAKIRVQCVGLDFPNYTITFKATSDEEDAKFNFTKFDTEAPTMELLPDKYDVYIEFNANEQFLGNVELRNGESSLLVVFSDISNETIMMRKYTLTLPNNMSILWILPQILTQALSELFVVLSAYQFAYEESPVSMKALVQSIWLLTTAGGNLLVVIITVLNIFQDQVVAFFSYAALMLVGMCIFIYLSKSYKIIPQAKVKAEPVVYLPILESVAKTQDRDFHSYK